MNAELNNVIFALKEARAETDRIALDSDAAIVGHLDKLEVTSSRIAFLESETTRLRDRGKAAVAERDHWQKRAMLAEQKLSDTKKSDRNGSETKRYEALKRFLAKEFHPDHSTGSGIEKAIRTETFKVIWAKVDELDKS